MYFSWSGTKSLSDNNESFTKGLRTQREAREIPELLMQKHATTQIYLSSHDVYVFTIFLLR